MPKRREDGKLYCAHGDHWCDPEEFSRDRSRPDGRYTYCLKCEAQYVNAWRRAHKDAYNAAQRQRYADNRERERAKWRARHQRQQEQKRLERERKQAEEERRRAEVTALRREMVVSHGLVSKARA